MKVLLTATNGARTSDRTAGGQRDREGRRVMRAAPIFSRSAWSPPEPSVSALRRAGNPQPGIGSRSLLGRPGSWADPLQVGHGRRGPSVDGSAPPTRCVCDASGDAFPDAPPGKSLDTGAISSSYLQYCTYAEYKLRAADPTWVRDIARCKFCRLDSTAPCVKFLCLYMLRHDSRDDCVCWAGIPSLPTHTECAWLRPIGHRLSAWVAI